MGMMELIIKPIKPELTTPCDMAASGNSQLDRAAFLKQTHDDALNPMNGNQAMEQQVRRIPVLKEPRDFNKTEADAIERQVALNQHRTTHGVRAIKALSKNETLDADLQVAYRGYQGNLARQEYRKVEANTRLYNTLQGLRPGYAALGLGSESAQNQATQRVAVLRAKIAGVMA